MIEYFGQKWVQIPNLKSRLRIFFVDIKGRNSANMVSTSFLMNSVGDTLSLHPSVLTFQHSSAIGKEKLGTSNESEALVIQMYYSLEKPIVNQNTIFQNLVQHVPLESEENEKRIDNVKSPQNTLGSKCKRDRGLLQSVDKLSVAKKSKMVRNVLQGQNGIHDIALSNINDKNNDKNYCLTTDYNKALPIRMNDISGEENTNINQNQSINENQEFYPIPDSNYGSRSPIILNKISTQVTAPLLSDFSHSLWNQMGNDNISFHGCVGDIDHYKGSLFSPIRQYNNENQNQNQNQNQNENENENENGNSQYYENTLDIIHRVACGLISIEGTSTSTSTSTSAYEIEKKNFPGLKCDKTSYPGKELNTVFPHIDIVKIGHKSFTESRYLEVDDSDIKERQKKKILLPVCDNKEHGLLIPDGCTKKIVIDSYVLPFDKLANISVNNNDDYNNNDNNDNNDNNNDNNNNNDKIGRAHV